MMLDELCLGDYYFESANILRNSLLLNSLLSNSEAWYNVTPKEISSLESVDEMLLRKIFSAHSKTPLELLYLESGNIPIRFILKAKRINFLWYILNEDASCLLHRVFQAQCENPVQGDWVKTVTDDIKEIDLKMNFKDIQKMSEKSFKNLVKSKVKVAAFEFLIKIQATKSKLRNIKYKTLELQNYLKPGNSMTIQDKSFIFEVRSRMLPVKCNFKTGQSDLKCRKCDIDDEDQQHLLTCTALEENTLLPYSEIPEYEMLFCDDPKKIQILENILKTKFKSLINKQIPSAHTSQLNALTSSAATYSKTSKNWIKYIYVYNNKR